MKKTYKNPTITVVNLQPIQFIALSKGDEFDSSKDVVLSRRRNTLWDEDDEE